MRIPYVVLAQAYLLLSFFADYAKILAGGLPVILLGDMFLVAVIFYVLATSKLHRELRWLLMMMVLTFAGMLLNFRYLSGLGIIIESRGLFMFIVTIFFYFFAFSRLGVDRLLKVGRFLDLVLKINIIVIIVEGVLANVVSDTLQPGLFTLFGDSGYRIQPHPVLFSAVPNGLVLGIQHASIISVIGVLTWFPWGGRIHSPRGRLFWLLASLASWALTVTGTSAIVFLVALLAVTYTGLLKRHAAFLMAASTMLIIYIGVSFERLVRARYVGKGIVDVAAFLERTIGIYLQPLKVMPDHIFEALIGTGHTTVFTKEYSPLLNAILHADFGLLLALVRFGFVLGFILILVYGIYLGDMWSEIRKSSLSTRVRERAVVAAAGGLVLALSMAHYTTLFQAGLMQYFAASLALAYFLVRPQLSGASESQRAYPTNL